MRRFFTAALIPYLFTCIFYNTPFADVYFYALIFLLLFSIIRKKRISLALTAVILSILAFVLSSNAYSIKSKSFYPIIDKPSTVKCIVSSTPEFSEGKISFTADLISAACNNEVFSIDGKTSVICKGTDISPSVRFGDIIEFKTKISLPQEASNDGGFSYRRYLNSHGIFTVCNTYDFSITNYGKGKETNSLLYRIFYLRSTLIEKCDAFLNADVSAFFKALLLGYRSDISDVAQSHISRSGISHVISVSGMHVSILMVILNSFTRKMRLKLKFIITPVLNIIFVIFITAFTGFSPSVIRAALMLIISNLSSLFYRENDSIQSLSLAVLILIIINPCAIYDVGLILSAVSVLGIILFNNRFKTFLSRFIKSNLISENFAVTLSAQIITLPINVFCFNSISVMGVFTNLIILPVIPLLMVLGISFLICPFNAMTSFIAGGIWLIIKFILLTTELISSIPFTLVKISFYTFITISVVCGVIAFSIFLLFKAKSEIKRFSCFLTASVFLIYVFFATPQKDFTLTAINTSYGDCTLIKLKSGKTILVDCSSFYNGKSDTENIYNYLLQCGVTRIDYAIISSLSENNINNLLTLTQHLNFGCIIAPDYLTADNAETVKNLYIAASSVKIPVYLMSKGDSFSPDEDVSLNVLLPDNTINYFNGNADMVFSLSYANRNILFTGNIKSHEKQLLTQSHIQADIIKLSDNGKHTWIDNEFLNKVNPSYAFAFTGTDALPEKTESILSDLNIIPFSTGVDKTVKISINQKGEIRIH